MLAKIIFFTLLVPVVLLGWHSLRIARLRMAQGNRFPPVGWLGVVEVVLATAGLCLMLLGHTDWAPWGAIGVLVPGVLPWCTKGGVYLMCSFFIKR